MNVLVAGIGNVFHSDDGFGPAVARHLQAGPALPAAVVDYGIRGVHLAYDLVDGPDRLVLVDAVALDEPAGTVVVMAPQDLPTSGPIDGHGLTIEAVLARARLLGAVLDDVVLVGAVPATTSPGMELSPAIQAAVPIAADRIRRLVHELAGTSAGSPA